LDDSESGSGSENEDRDLENYVKMKNGRIRRTLERNKSRLCCPCNKKNFYRPAAVKLRSNFLPLGLMHIVLLITNAFLYDNELFGLMMECALIWLCFINFLQLDKLCVLVQCLLYF